MGSIWDFGLKKEGVAKKGKAPGKVNFRLYGILCLVLAIVLAAVFIIILATGQTDGASLLPLVFAALIGPGFLAVIGVMLWRLARGRARAP
jgi:hypothetical protein